MWIAACGRPFRKRGATLRIFDSAASTSGVERRFAAPCSSSLTLTCPHVSKFERNNENSHVPSASWGLESISAIETIASQVSPLAGSVVAPPMICNRKGL